MQALRRFVTELPILELSFEKREKQETKQKRQIIALIRKALRQEELEAIEFIKYLKPMTDAINVKSLIKLAYSKLMKSIAKKKAQQDIGALQALKQFVSELPQDQPQQQEQIGEIGIVVCPPQYGEQFKQIEINEEFQISVPAVYEQVEYASIEMNCESEVIYEEELQQQQQPSSIDEQLQQFNACDAPIFIENVSQRFRFMMQDQYNDFCRRNMLSYVTDNSVIESLQEEFNSLEERFWSVFPKELGGGDEINTFEFDRIDSVAYNLKQEIREIFGGFIYNNYSELLNDQNARCCVAEQLRELAEWFTDNAKDPQSILRDDELYDEPVVDELFIGQPYKAIEPEPQPSFDYLFKIDLNEEDFEQEETVTIKGKVRKTLKDKRMLKNNQKLVSQLKAWGFKKHVIGSGRLITMSRNMPEDVSDSIKEFMIGAILQGYDKLEETKGMTRDESSLVKETVLNREANRITQKLRNTLTQFETLANVKLNLRMRMRNTVITGETLEDMVRNMIEELMKYESRNMEKRDIIEDELTSQLKMEVIIADKIRIKGRLTDMINDEEESHWVVIDPNTTQHCVADCLAALELMRSDKVNEVLSAWGYIKKRGKTLAEELKIKEGCTHEQLKAIADKYKICTVSSLQDHFYSGDDAFLYVADEHAVLYINPKVENAQKMKELTQRFNREDQILMKKWKSVEEKLEEKNEFIEKKKGEMRRLAGLECHEGKISWDEKEAKLQKADDWAEAEYKKMARPYKLIAYDFEWFVKWVEKTKNGKTNKEGEECPYMFGITDGEYIHVHEGVEDYAKAFIDQLIVLCKMHSGNELLVIAHSGLKADHPLLMKALLNDKRFRLVRQNATKMAKISYGYEVTLNDKIEKVTFIDSINHYKGELEDMLPAMGCSVTKQDVNHNIINEHNWKEEVQRQNIRYYQECDVKGLWEAMTNYDRLIKEAFGFSLWLNRIMTSASLAQAIYFHSYYKGNMYRMPLFMQEFCRRAYFGGMCEVFHRGVFKRVRCIDINSSYPKQMIMGNLPTGPYEWVHLFEDYDGQGIRKGIYQIIVKKTPKIMYPCLPTKDPKNGQTIFPIFKNKRLWVTSEELDKATQQGYEIFIEKALVSQALTDPYDKYILEAYEKRRQIKKEMNQHAKGSPEYIKLDQLQELEKLKMNSTYGKLCWAQLHEVTNVITSDEQFILKEFEKGNVNHIKQLNDRYFQYSGQSESQTKYTNFMIGAFITARARLQLVDMLEKLTAIGAMPLAVDTDSVYFDEHNMTEEDFKKLCANEVDGSILGKWKLEMDDNVGEDVAHGVFVTLKTYALKGPTTFKEKVKAKGIDEWIISDRKKKFGQRREDSGVEQVTFQTMVDLVEGKPIVFTKKQQSIQMGRLQDEQYTHIKKEAFIQKIIKGKLSKRIELEDGTCVPQTFIGEDYVNYPAERTVEGDQRWIKYITIGQAQNDMKMDWEQICDKYCVVQTDEMREYFVILKDAKEVCGNLQRKYGDIHQMFGNMMVMSLDVDLKPLEFSELNEINGKPVKKPKNWPEEVIKKIKKIYEGKLDNAQFSVVDRCRPEKISYHIRCNKLVDKIEMRYLITNLQWKLSQKKRRHMFESVDLAIYRENGSLRLTDLDYCYDRHMPYIQIKSNEELSQIRKKQQMRKKTKIGEATEKDLIKMVEKLQKEEPKLKGWNYRNARVDKTYTIAYMDRTYQAETYCDKCKKDHDKDNSLAIKFTAKKYEIICLKSKRQ